ncbi:MAG: alpha/beta fold hydrolase, partial [Pseudomonadota bacterium]
RLSPPQCTRALIHPVRTEYSVLLVHGINDSAYYMADVGELLYRNGFNVITVLLPGHGTNTKDMLNVKAEQWRSEVELGLKMASLVGKKIMLGGFSLGGALAIDAVLRHQDIHGLLLFSPAIRLRSYDSIAALACAPGLRSYMVETKLMRNPVKYKRRAGNGACQLSRLMQHNLAFADNDTGESRAKSNRLRKMARRVRIPTFLAMSYADARISPRTMLEFAGSVPAPVFVATFGSTEHADAPVLSNGGTIRHIADDNLPHSFLVRRSNPHNGQKNPYFDLLGEAVIDFLNEHFHLTKMSVVDRGE